MRTKDLILSDLNAVPTSAITAALTNRGFHALLAYRTSYALHTRKIPLLPLILSRLIQILYSIDIDYRAQIGPGCLIVHGVGLVIGQGAVIGRNAKLYHGVTLGIAERQHNDGFPRLGDNVLVGAGAKLLGAVHIGDGAKIGANAVVVTDVPAGAVAVGIPARITGGQS